jgi:hypothetical protein
MSMNESNLYSKAWDEAMRAIEEYQLSSKSAHMATWTRGRIDGIDAIARLIDDTRYFSEWEKWANLRKVVDI